MNVKKICVLLLIGAIVLVGTTCSASVVSAEDITSGGIFVLVDKGTGRIDRKIIAENGEATWTSSDGDVTVYIKSVTEYGVNVDITYPEFNTTKYLLIPQTLMKVGDPYIVLTSNTQIYLEETIGVGIIADLESEHELEMQNHMGEIANLTAENALLVQENSDLKNETGSLNSSVIGLTTDREDAITKRNVLQEEYDELRDEKVELEDEISEYVDEIDWLNTKLWMFSIMALVLGGFGGAMIRDKTFREGLGVAKAKGNVLENIEGTELNKVKSEVEIAEENILKDLTEIMHADLRSYNKAELSILGSRLKLIEGYDKNQKIAPLLKAVQTAYDKEVKRLQGAKKK